MSTISQALLKNKFEQTGNMPPIQQIQNKTNYWKIAFSIALIVIIGLLSVLLYLQLYPVKAVQKAVIEEKVASKIVQTTSDKRLVKMTFETQPIPEPIIKEIKAPPIKPQVNNQENQVLLTANTERTVNSEEQAIRLDTAKDVKIEEIIEQDVNYDEISSELKKRFDLAVLLTEMEQNEATEEENIADTLTDDFDDGSPEVINDGSDIHLMSSNFQNKVPVMRYDSHVYSSLKPQRWIRINGETLVEGSFDSSGKIQLIEIQPQRSIFRVDRQSFSLESLTDWKGY